MDLDRARFLISLAAARVLADAETSLVGLSLHQRAAALRKELPPADAAALSEQIDLRAHAARRWEAPPGDWRFTRDGLEMATHPIVAARRAARLAAHGLPVVDLTCGIGGDLAVLASEAHTVLGVERDPALALLARHNTGARAGVLVGDAVQPPVAPAGKLLFIDPARRARGRRRFDPAAFTPNWDTCVALLREAAGGCIKGPPGIAPEALPPEAEVEFVQLGRSLREAAIYTGCMARPGLRRAVLLPASDELTSDEPEIDAAASPIGAVIYDPASALTRAGLVRQLGHRLGAALVDPHLGYLTASSHVCTPFADAFEVLDVIPFSLARLKSHLRETARVPHEIRRRAFPIEPDDLRRQVGRLEGEPVTLLCTTIETRRVVIVGRHL